MKINWEGVMPAITTKFTEDDRLDFQALAQNINAQLEAGVNGIIIGGSLGEASTLSREEKENLLSKTLEIVNQKVPVIMNIAEQSTKTAISVAQKAEELGADGIMLLPPLCYKATDDETVAYFAEVAKSISIPIMIYNNPVDYKIEVTLDMFDELIKYENIQAVKESTRDISNVIRFKNKFGDRIKILCGVDTLALECLVTGADGWVAGLVAAYPAETVAIFKLVKAGEIEEAVKIYRWFMPLLELDISPQLVQNIKLAEVATGLGTERVRAPRLPLQGKERMRVVAIIEEANSCRPELPRYKNL